MMGMFVVPGSHWLLEGAILKDAYSLKKKKKCMEVSGLSRELFHDKEQRGLCAYCWLKGLNLRAYWWDFPGGPAVETMLPLQGAQVRSLVRKLGSRMPRGVVKK